MMYNKRESNNLKAKAEKFWGNLCVYRKDSAKRISKNYEYDLNMILNILEGFPEIKSYSGHCSGKKENGVSESAMATLDRGIQYLNDCLKKNAEKPHFSM